MSLKRVTLLIWTAVIALFSLTLLPSVASAVSETPPPASLEVGAESAFNLDAALVAVILGTLIPLINGIVTKLTTSTQVKVGITLFLAAVAGLINTSLTDGGDAVISQASLLNAILSFITAITTYLGLFKPLEITSSPVTKTDANGTLTTAPGKLANVGVK